MNPNHFDREVDRLSKRFTGKVYGDEFAKLLWRECQSLSDTWLTKTVDEFIGSCRQPPLMPEFREQIAVERDKAWAKQKHVAPGFDWNKFASCDTCWDNGVYLCTKPAGEDRSYYTFRCHCAKGQRDPRSNIPQFTIEHAKEFVWLDVRKLAARPELQVGTMPKQEYESG